MGRGGEARKLLLVVALIGYALAVNSWINPPGYRTGANWALVINLMTDAFGPKGPALFYFIAATAFVVLALRINRRRRH